MMAPKKTPQEMAHEYKVKRSELAMKDKNRMR